MRGQRGWIVDRLEGLGEGVRVQRHEEWGMGEGLGWWWLGLCCRRC